MGLKTKKYTLKGDEAISVVYSSVFDGGITIQDADLGDSTTICLAYIPELIEVLQEIVKENLK